MTEVITIESDEIISIELTNGIAVVGTEFFGDIDGNDDDGTIDGGL